MARLKPETVRIENVVRIYTRVTCLACGASHIYDQTSKAVAARELHLRGDRCLVDQQTGILRHETERA